MAGQITTGFSKPYVALYSNSGTTITYTSGQVLSEGVSASFSIDTSDDNNFYADNIVSESAGGTFTSGEVSLTVKGLDPTSERLIMGLPAAGDDGLTPYGDDQSIPFCGLGFIYRTQSAGVVSYQAIILPKVTFQMVNHEAATQEETIDWQTQELTATIHRADDAKHNWKYIGSLKSTEASAEADLTTFFGISAVVTT